MADQCCHCQQPTRRRGGGIISTAFKLVLLYALLVFGGGTLQRLQSPVAVELGRLVHTVTFVEPTIDWAEANAHPALAGTLHVLSNGAPIR